MKTALMFLLIMALLCLGGCSNEDPGGREPRSGSISASDTVGGSIHIVFKWPGDDFASRQELEIRDKIARTIDERGIGSVMRVGTGMGTMEIVVKVEKNETARPEIEAILRKMAPDMKWFIR